jgi:hypothetical protein
MATGERYRAERPGACRGESDVEVTLLHQLSYLGENPIYSEVALAETRRAKRSISG